MQRSIVQNRELQRIMYELPTTSCIQRVGLAAAGAVSVALACWLLYGGGSRALESLLGWSSESGDPVRKACLAAALSIYYVRMLFTTFVFLKRGVGWSEVFTVAPWLVFIYLLLAFSGGRNPAPFGPAAAIGVALFVAGSWMNTQVEYARYQWKRRPENRGRLYTLGLFHYSRHPNYLGDLISFSGMCLISGAWITAVIPVLMLAGFVFVNIPVLDSHLHDRYGAAFDEYARRTRKLIPLLY